ncbi:Ig-like domain-containing protein [Curtobacterium sp. Curtsp57]|uniref:Ig-like domain-containing protein n=1 Tax=Curtobacterium sp. Curtsp57 TaxID=3243047 RepID=UPI0039B53798
MTPIPFRTTAVVCSIVTASLGVGLVSPAVASATAAPAAAQTGDPRSTSTVDEPIDTIPVDPELEAAQVLSIRDTTVGARVVLGHAGSDHVYLLDGATVISAWPGETGVFQVFAPDKYSDRALDLVRVHIAADGSTTRTERAPLPRTLRVDGIEDENTFVPGSHRFAGSASAGATITATDEDGTTLFTTDAAARAADGPSTWSAEADLAATNHTVTFTQTLPDGRSSRVESVRFTPAAAEAPSAPEVRPSERRIDGAFTVWGNVDERTAAVEVRNEDGEPIGEPRVTEEHVFVATIPQEYVGTTLDVVAVDADGVESPAVQVDIAALPTDPDVVAPALRELIVHPNGRLQFIGELQETHGIQVLDGDRVVAHYQESGSGWGFSVGSEFTGKQLDLVALRFDGQRYAATSERVALPRLLEVDGIEAENSYKPGERTFSGSAEAGATIVATDAAGTELFRAEAKQSRSGVAAWEASADLASKDGYEITFTQTTADGRTSVMKDITFTPDEDVAPQDLTLTSHRSGGTFMPGPQRFSGTATPGATVEFNPFGWSPAMAGYTLTTTADATTGAWTIERGLADVEYHVLAFRQDVDGDVVQQITGVRLTPEATADLVLTSPGDRFTPGTVQTFTGTATPGTTVTLDPFGDSEQYAAYRLTTTADATTGEWTITRPLADSKYLVVLTQADSGLKVKRIVHPMQPAN